ncbi:MAG: C40 family peptidase [Clostridia bacterium]|nr:C40 family peptidase [Clostridia bacterium]
MQDNAVFYVKNPSPFIFNMLNEPSDQLLFGWKVTCIGNASDNKIYCKTDYGYSGYIDAESITNTEYITTHKIVSRFCPVLENPDYTKKLLMTLPYGSKIRILSSDEKFSKADIFGKICYVPSAHISPDENTKKTPQDIIDTASKYLDTPYLWGGKTPLGIDCSGLCFMAYYLNGITIYRDARFPFYEEYAVKQDDLRPSDLIFYKGHMALYIGGGKIIHSNSRDGKATVSTVDTEHIVGCASLYELLEKE